MTRCFHCVGRIEPRSELVTGTVRFANGAVIDDVPFHEECLSEVTERE